MGVCTSKSQFEQVVVAMSRHHWRRFDTTRPMYMSSVLFAMCTFIPSTRKLLASIANRIDVGARARRLMLLLPRYIWRELPLSTPILNDAPTTLWIDSLAPSQRQ